MTAFFIVFIIFLVLKLIGVITFSWWWVFLPLVIEIVLDIFVIGLLNATASDF